MTKISLKSVLGAIEGAQDDMTELVVSSGKKLDKFNLEMKVNSPFLKERIFINAQLRISEHELNLQKEFKKDPILKEEYEKVSREWNEVDKEPVGFDEQGSVRKKIAEFKLPEAVEEAENGKDIIEAVGIIRAKHAEFLRDVKSRLDRDPDLMAIFEGTMEENGGEEILNYIKRIDADQPL